VDKSKEARKSLQRIGYADRECTSIKNKNVQLWEKVKERDRDHSPGARRSKPCHLEKRKQRGGEAKGERKTETKTPHTLGRYRGSFLSSCHLGSFSKKCSALRRTRIRGEKKGGPRGGVNPGCGRDEPRKAWSLMGKPKGIGGQQIRERKDGYRYRKRQERPSKGRGRTEVR